MTELQPGDFPAQGVDAFIAGRMRRSSNSTKWAETRSISAIERLRLHREAAELTMKAMEVANPQERERLLAEARFLAEKADREDWAIQ